MVILPMQRYLWSSAIIWEPMLWREQETMGSGCLHFSKQFPTRDAFNQAFLAKIDEYDLDLIVLAGFLVMIPAAMTEKYKGRIINIHPSLIPSFCGVGYYGLKVHEAAWPEE